MSDCSFLNYQKILEEVVKWMDQRLKNEIKETTTSSNNTNNTQNNSNNNKDITEKA
jgi:hypothetical protein